MVLCSNCSIVLREGAGEGACVRAVLIERYLIPPSWGLEGEF